MEIKTENKFDLVIENYNIYQQLEFLKKQAAQREVVFLCVGNSKVWFDSFGPLVGSFLQYLEFPKYIYGNLKTSITKSNVEKYIDMIYKFHINPFIVVIDSAISNTLVPKIKIKKGQTTVACMSDNPVMVGDYSILFCLNKKQMKDSFYYKNLFTCVKKVGRMIKFIFTN